jgi:malonyl-CoA O-methyltransferase
MPSLGTDAAYARWAPHYPSVPHNALMEVEQQAVLFLLPALHALRALDVGCGTGRYMRILADCGAAHVFGIDRSAAMLAHAKAANVAQADVRELPLGRASVDVIVSGLVLNDVAELGAALGEMGRVLKPRGVLVYSTIHPRGAEAQWTRTFDADGQTWSLPAHWHSLHAHERACAASDLVIEHVAEPALLDRPGPVALVIRACRR